MDHIPPPSRLSHPLRAVSLFAPETEYDQGPLYGYLGRIGWTKEDILNINSSQKPRDSVHGVLQTWTYFGMLFEVTGTPVSVHDLSKGENERVFLATHNLPGILGSWIQQEASRSVSLRRQHLEHVSECLVLMADVYDTIYLANPNYLDGGFHLSVQLLYEYLVRAATLVGEAGNTSTFASSPIQYRTLLGPLRFVENRMKRLGWCPSEIHMLAEFSSMTEMVFASLLDRPGPDKGHSRCNSRKCLAYQIANEEEYFTKHISPSCACEFVYALHEVLAEVLLGQADSVPLVALSTPLRGRDGLLYAQLLSSHHNKEHVPYVAISHVWSDGLGNPKNNAIPLCQFNRIAKLVAALYNGEQVMFWLDTLCFPLEPQAAYDMALVRMKQSYEDADKVLVLDRYLLEQKCSEMSDEEIAVRITCAPWNRRLWTLQEGMLAQALLVQFDDTFVDLSRWLRRDRAPTTTLQGLVFCQIWRNYASLRVFETEESKKMDIQQAKEALTFRSTSVSDDEPLCLGNLLGIDPESVVRAGSRTERMKLIWRSIPKAFASTIFWSSPKLQEDGFRWASASLMKEGCGKVKISFEDARWDAEMGLIVTLPGILFTQPSLRLLDSFRLILDRNRFIVQWDLKWSPKLDKETLPWNQTVTSKCTGKYAILLTKPLHMEMEDLTDAASFAQLCRVLDTEEPRVKVQILGRVRLYRLDCLKHHPDLLVPKTTQSAENGKLPPQQPLKPDEGAQGNSAKSRADSIWHYDDRSEISEDAIVREGVWCVD